MTAVSGEGINERIARYAQALSAGDLDSAGLIAELTDYAAQVIPGAQHAGITSVSGGKIETPAATGQLPVALDEIQRRHGEGPCLVAAQQTTVVEVDDLTAETRWPKFAAEVVATTPIRSIVAFSLFRTDHAHAALNVYAEAARAFDSTTREIGAIFASQAGLMWDAERSREQFRAALASRDTIGQAKGMIMERFDVDAEHAFAMLRKLSQDANTRVADIARTLIDADHPSDEGGRTAPK